MVRVYCKCCGFKLTFLEATYYGPQCEQCVQDDNNRVSAWLQGGQDKWLETVYGKLPDARAHAFDA